MIRLLHIICILLFLTTTQAAKTITLISWNIKDFGKSCDDKEMNAIADYVKHADIIAIQEVVAKHPNELHTLGTMINVYEFMINIILPKLDVPYFCFKLKL
ncbi:MAG: hypothetical protein IPL20_16785 [Saprospiraceae bacterium]|nr:hypothetical protein [Saprospiraceae bacterium]